MTTRRTCCDRCGNFIILERTRLRVECGPLVERYPDGIDLCMDCVGSWLVPALQSPRVELVTA